MTKIIAGSSSKKLAYDLSKYMQVEYLEAQIERFADQELRVQLAMRLNDEDVIIVQSTCRPANDHLMEMLLLVDAAKRAGARKCIALMPYFGYSRQDRASYDWGPLSARLIANLLEASGVDHIVTLDLHSQETAGFFKISALNIDPIPLFAETIGSQKDLVVVSPDVGGFMRAKRLSEVLGMGLATINKSRAQYNKCEMDNVIGDVSGKHCLIVDDIVDTGETLLKAVELLKKHGVLNIEAIVTHPVLSGDAIELLTRSDIQRIITTNSIEQKSLPSKFFIIDIVPSLALALGYHKKLSDHGAI